MPSQAPSLDGEELGERQGAIGADDGQALQHLDQLPVRAVGGNRLQMRAGGDQPDVAALLQEAARERCGDGHRVLLGRVEPGFCRPLAAVVRRPVHRSRGGAVRDVVQIEDDPDVGGWILVELLDHQPAEARGGRPGDAIEAVARRVVADAGDVGRHVGCAAFQGAAAGEGALRNAGFSQLDHGRIDDHLGRFPELEPAGEDAQRVARPELDRTEVVAPAAHADRARIPFHGRATGNGDDAAGIMTRKCRTIHQLDPELAQTAGVSHRQGLAQRLPDLRTIGAGLAHDRDPAQAQLRPDPGGSQDDEQRDDQVVGDAPIGDLADHQDRHDEEDDFEAVHPGSFAYGPVWRVPQPRPAGATGCAPGTGTTAEDISNDNAAIDIFDPRRGIDDDPVRERRLGKHLDVVRGHEVASMQGGPGARGVVEGQRASGRGSQVDVVVPAGRLDQVDDVLADRRGDVNLLDRGLRAQEILEARGLLQIVQGMRAMLPLEHLELPGATGVPHRHADQEAVELGLGQGKGPLVFDRVLGGEDDEWLGQRDGSRRRR